jgi:peptidase E
MPVQPGIITLMGSGELTASMVEVHKALVKRHGNDARAVFIDTPAGFQLNADHISQRAVDYFQTRVQHPLTIASLKSADAGDPIATERSYRALNQADYILIGPGSPTYALRQWRRTRVPELIARRIQAGGSLVAASAAALTVGRFTLPVYEIYKVGQPPYWEEGLNILQRFGFDWVVLPHWNNAEGGNHDTRFCFMGEPRMTQLEALLPASVTLVGLDEHTALVIDLSRTSATIRGIGRVTIRRQGQERIFTKGDHVPLALLRGETEITASGPALPSPHEKTPPAAVEKDTVWDPLYALGEKIQNLIENNRSEQATGALLELERHIWDMREALQERSAMGAAREVLRDMLALVGTRLAQRPADRKACLQPLVAQILALRAKYRQEKQWDAADALRDCLVRAGIEVEDTDEGVIWHLDQ